MRTFSRNMPSPPPPEVPGAANAYVAVGLVLLVLLIAGTVLWTAVTTPIFGLILGGSLLVAVVLQHRDTRRLQRMAAQRVGENLCSFARTFNRRLTDPWVLRATYEELQPYCRFRGGVLPLRATDRFEEDLRIDGGELDYVALDVARRAWRTMEEAEANPFYGRVQTVKDLVRFLHHQPVLHR